MRNGGEREGKRERDTAIDGEGVRESGGRERAQTHCHHYIANSFQITATIFYIHHPTDRIVDITTFVTPVMER